MSVSQNFLHVHSRGSRKLKPSGLRRGVGLREISAY